MKPITLKGSIDIVTEFFKYGIHNILYQRGIYEPERFERAKKYGLTLMVVSDRELSTYVDSIIAQFRSWLEEKTVRKVVLVISSRTSHEVIERWEFNVVCDKDADENSVSNKSEQTVTNEIRAIIRQITGSVSFLPIIEEPCVFEVLLHTDKGAFVPSSWEESDAKLITTGKEEMPLRSFSTGFHEVNNAVQYKRS